ncbi:MAG: cation diffusion facilitator family transporter [Chitinophagales bacterium]|nr:cation diffusion facilitator family transporter [Chitinophagales bacterium]MDW8426987.1 cation diffusion facilitator family transporter [Chitinophagales bacterium]
MNKNLSLQRIITLASVLLLGAKTLAYVLTHSNAVLSDALESLVNLAAAFMGLYSLQLSAKPRDSNHPYGHGKVEFLSAGIEGSLILFAGVLIIAKAIYNFFRPQQLGALDAGLIILASTGIINFVLGRMAVRQAKRGHSPALLGSGRHLESDAYSTFGVLAAVVLLYFFPYSWLDNGVALLFGAVVSVMGFRVIRSAVAGIMDEADMHLLNQIIRFVNDRRRPAWVDLHNMRVIKYGAVLHVDCHLTLPWYYSVAQAHEEVHELRQVMMQSVQNPVEFFIHTDACVPQHQCRLCLLDSCPHRQHAFQMSQQWTLETTLADRKHGM